MAPKVKSSVYVNGELWRRFKKHAAEHGVEVSVLLEELILNLRDAWRSSQALERLS